MGVKDLVGQVMRHAKEVVIKVTQSVKTNACRPTKNALVTASQAGIHVGVIAIAAAGGVLLLATKLFRNNRDNRGQ